MKIQENIYELVNCNLCGSNDYSYIDFARKKRVVRCKMCGLIYQNPRSPYALDREPDSLRLYGNYTETEEYVSNARKGIFKRILDRLDNNIDKPFRSLLDIGCGQGHFLKLAKDLGWQVEGIELAQSACKYAREKFGIEIKNRDLKEADFPKDYFDAVTLWNVLDHLLDPLDTLKEIYRILKPEGILIIRVPNVNLHLFAHKMFSLFLSDIKSDRLRDPSVIVNYGFSPSSIFKMLNKAGFNQVMVSNFQPSQGDPYKTLGILGEKCVDFIKKAVYLIAQLIFYITFRRCVLGSSLGVFAQKSFGQ